MTTLYGVIFAVALLMIIVCYFTDKKHDKWLLLLFSSVAVCNCGYFLLSISKTLECALWANRLAYLGNVFLPFFMLMMIFNLLRLKLKKVVPFILSAINVFMLFIAASGGWLKIYYKDVSLKTVNGVSFLVKEYGPLHNIYKIFLFAYFAAMIGVIIYALVKKTAVSVKHPLFIAFVVIGNIVIWLVENVIKSSFEFISISYIITEGLILLLYSILQDYERIKKDNQCIINVSDEESSDIDNKIFENLSLREKEVLKYLLENRKRKEIADILFVTESTIKKHTSSIYKKLKVTNRAELFEKIGKHR